MNTKDATNTTNELKDLKEQITMLTSMIKDVVIELTYISEKMDSIECLLKDKDKLKDCKDKIKMVYKYLIL